jgi:hypothetical protein
MYSISRDIGVPTSSTACCSNDLPGLFSNPPHSSYTLQASMMSIPTCWNLGVTRILLTSPPKAQPSHSHHEPSSRYGQQQPIPAQTETLSICGHNQEARLRRLTAGRNWCTTMKARCCLLYNTMETPSNTSTTSQERSPAAQHDIVGAAPGDCDCADV